MISEACSLRAWISSAQAPSVEARAFSALGASFSNNFDNDGEDGWRVAGWCWSHDHFTERRGAQVGWLPFTLEPADTVAAPPLDQAPSRRPDSSDETDPDEDSGN